MKYKRNFLLYLSARFISLIGTGIQLTALPLFILDLTHSGMLMGISSAINIIPNVLISPTAGILGDRKNRKYLMIISDFSRGILTLILSILAFRGILSIYVLFAVQILVSIMNSIFYSSSSAIISELIDEDELMKAMSTRGGLDAVSMIVGPAIGGVLYGFCGIKAIFFINALSFIISGILSLFMIYVCKNHKNKNLSNTSLFKEMGEVLTFIKSNKGLIQLFAFAMISNLLISPFIDIVMPYVVKTCIGFSSGQYGFLISIFTIGALAGNILLNLLSKKMRVKTIMNLGVLIEAVMLFALSIAVSPELVKLLGSHSISLFLSLSLICIIIGIANALLNTPINTNLQKMVPNYLRSRFFSILGVFMQCTVPIGSLVYGLVLDKFPYFYILLIVTTLNALASIIFMVKAVNEVYEPSISEN
ncbi:MULTISPECIES: MFS transporter [Clostridium]|uniref:MFS transporter n=1 Tax=Clostridium TaxID=1485 RepID=UPI0008250DE0|nr:MULTISPECIES: MFS transporter [Clostridium]PJI07201.1 MFS transporter [Clostridium sp. CT7]